MKRYSNKTRKFRSRRRIKKRAGRTRKVNMRRVKKGGTLSLPPPPPQSRANASQLKEYIITIHKSDGRQIKDIDFSINDPLELISEIEHGVGVKNIVPMKESDIPRYNRIMNRPHADDISDEELASIWYVKTDMNLNNNYDFTYENKPYVAKFHRI